ncbi:MAG: Stp1/IreP family PP2C-type Ser/Thr phosphatase [Candidatus Humimicrobiaceae bacterium]
MKINVYGASSVGRVRKLNEDSFSFDSSRGDKGSIFLICDGMGGHKAGEVASQYASIKIVEYFYKSPQKDIPSKLNESIRMVNREIYNLSQKDSSKRGMGTTVIAVVIFENTLYFANVGDSRAYLLRNDSIRKLTKDHSWLEEKISEGVLSPSEARNNPNKNIITKCVGYEPDVEPNFGSIVLKEGDRLILCSDGLWDELNDFKIKEMALSNSDLKKSVERLISAAEGNGGKDNITVVGIDYGKVKISIINKSKDKILLSVISVLAIFLLVFSVVIFNFYIKAKRENNNYQKNNIELNKEKNELEKKIDGSEKENNYLSEEIDNLKKENKDLITSNNDLGKKLKEASETSQINNENDINLAIKRKLNVNGHFGIPVTVKKFFVYGNNFLLFLNGEKANELFLLKLKDSDIDPNFDENTSTNSPPIKFIFPGHDENSKIENIKVDEFIFDNNSASFYIISGNSLYKSKKEVLFLSDGSVSVDKAGELPQAFLENELGKYLIIEDELYYFNYDQNLNNIQFYNISSKDITQGALSLESIKYDITSIDLNFDLQNQKLYVLLKSESENYLCIFNKNGREFKYLKAVLLENKYGLPNKILINDIQSNGEVFIYFKNKSLNSYNVNLEPTKHYVISEPVQNAVLEIEDALVNMGILYLRDNSNNIFSTDLPQ